MATSAVTGAKADAAPAKLRPLIRLLLYVLPYWWQVLASVMLMALVGLLDAGRVLLIGPIFDSVLKPESQEKAIPLFKLPGSDRFLDLQQLVPSLGVRAVFSRDRLCFYRDIQNHSGRGSELERRNGGRNCYGHAVCGG